MRCGVQCWKQTWRGCSGGTDEKQGTVVGQKSRVVQWLGRRQAGGFVGWTEEKGVWWWDRQARGRYSSGADEHLGYSGGSDVQGVQWWNRGAGGCSGGKDLKGSTVIWGVKVQELWSSEV